LLLAGVCALVALLIFGARDITGYASVFLAAIPGLAYGYYQPDGKPVEYWLRTGWRYHIRPRVLSPVPKTPLMRRLKARMRFWLYVMTRARRLARKGAKAK
jgi:hypothetical protein